MYDRALHNVDVLEYLVIVGLRQFGHFIVSILQRYQLVFPFEDLWLGDSLLYLASQVCESQLMRQSMLDRKWKRRASRTIVFSVNLDEQFH